MKRKTMGIGAALVLLAGACLAAPAGAAEPAAPADGGGDTDHVERNVDTLIGVMGGGLKHLWGGRKKADAATEAPAPSAKPVALGAPEPAEPGMGDAMSALKGIAGDVMGDDTKAHDYESPLTRDDEICTQLVDPFKISDNLEEVAGTAARKRLTNFLTRLAKKESKADPAKTLAVARAAARRLNWMPMPVELRYGTALHERHVETSNTFQPRSGKGAAKARYERADALLERVLSQVEGEHPYHFQLFLENNRKANAVAAPGGYIYMNTGALESDYAELILAHEVAHVLKRHVTREMQSRLLDVVQTHEELKALVKDRDPQPAQLAMRTASLVGDFIRLSRQQELQADACAVRIVAKDTDRDMDALVDGFVASLKAEPDADQPWYHISTHPDYPDRAKRMKEVVAALRAAPVTGVATASSETTDTSETTETAAASAPAKKDAAAEREPED